VADGVGKHVTRVRIFYPADPVGTVPSGIDTFIRGLIKWAPPDLSFSLVGMTTDQKARPVGRWTRCELVGGKSFDFYPVVAVADAGSRSRLPLSIRYMVALRSALGTLSEGFDVMDFHRPEPSLLVRRDARPKNAYFHQDPSDVSQEKSDMLWRHMPGLYERMEAKALARFDSIWCVRESGVATLRQRYPAFADHIRFSPTWVDPDQFFPVPDADRQDLRVRLAQEHNVDPAAQWIISVGRLDTQKDPLMLADAFQRVVGREKGKLAWLVVGDGVLRSELEGRIASAGLGSRVHLLGLRDTSQVAELMRAADLFALSSAYEGMPMALLEAMGSGLPTVTTAVGEVGRVVKPGINGVIVPSNDPEAFAEGLIRGLHRCTGWRGSPAVDAVRDFRPGTVLTAAYGNYRELSRRERRMELAVVEQAELSQHQRPRREVLGIAVDVLAPERASDTLVSWAAAGLSRYIVFCNVHSVVTARQNGRHRLALTGADMALPDGAPVAWSMRAKGARGQERLDGPGTMWRLCEQAEASGVRIGLYGSTPAVLDALTFRVKQHFPRLKVAYAWSPPFRALTSAEDEAVCGAIREAGVGLLFVGLGCPKQEQWMSDHRGRIPAVMLGVGAAFDFHADVAARAPQWMRDAGLEWLYRLIGDPRRLARRYLVTNTVFIASSGVEAVKSGAAAVKSGVSAARRFVGPGKSRIPVGPDVGDQQKTIADDQL